MGNPKAKNKKRRRILLISATILTLGAAGAFLGFKRRDVAVPVQFDKVVRRDITETVVANGRIQPVVQVVINPEVSGEIIDLPVKEGQCVKKGDLLVKIRPDNYIASRNSAEANYKSALAAQTLAKANLDKAQFEFTRSQELFNTKFVSESQFLDAKTTLEVSQATFENSIHQAEQAKAALARAEDDLSKCIITAPIAGTVTRLNSERGERVVGTAMMAGTEIMTVADLDKMEARVDVGEIDVVLIKVGQKAHLEFDSFRDHKFNGIVTEIANAAEGLAGRSQPQQQASSQQQEATKFQVKILLTEKEQFRPGMSVSAEIETRYRTNVLAVPIMAVTARMPKDAAAQEKKKQEDPALITKAQKKEEPRKTDEIVFVVNGDSAKSVKVKTGISDDTYMEITDGLTNDQQIISGGYAAVSRLLEDGKKVKKEELKKKPRENKA